MTGLRRSLGLLAVLSALSFPAHAANLPDEVSDLFAEGLELLRQGEDEAALEKFTAVLAMQPDHEAAYQLWKDTDDEIWVDMLVKGGQYELVAKRFLDLASIGQAELQDDPDAIQALIRQLQSDDVMERRKAQRELAANHGEYAVPYMIHHLANRDDEDRRVLVMHALTEMNRGVVLPLLASLRTDDAYLRRNVCLVLGYLGDPRAGAALRYLAENDEDEGVRMAAKEGAMKVGATGTPLELFLKLGNDFHHRAANVLNPGDWSDVVWAWRDGELVKTEVPRYLYADELAKRAYLNALLVDPSSLDARAGLARAYVSQLGELEMRIAAGADVEGAERLEGAELAVNSSGVDALDLALQWSVADRDASTAGQLLDALGGLAGQPTPGMTQALQQQDGAMRAEAAVALGRLAYANNRAADADTVRALGETAGREVVRIAMVIDSNAERGRSMASALEGAGFMAMPIQRGTLALHTLHQIPGLDVIVVAERLDDLTTAQVVDDIRRTELLAETPILLMGSEEAAEAYGDSITGAISAGDVAAVEAAVADEMNADRDRANVLAAEAAMVLELLARGAGKTDLSGVTPQLVGTLTSERPDAVIVPAMGTLGAIAGPDAMGPLMSVLASEERSDEARVAAADAIGRIATRSGMTADGAALNSLLDVMGSDATLSVRSAAASAAGRMRLDAEQRAQLAAATRVMLNE